MKTEATAFKTLIQSVVKARIYRSLERGRPNVEVNLVLENLNNATLDTAAKKLRISTDSESPRFRHGNPTPDWEDKPGCLAQFIDVVLLP